MTKTWWETHMGGSVLSFLKADWKVSDTGSMGWASSLKCCGFKSKLKYPEFENLIWSDDFVCFVETKTDMFDSIDLPCCVFLII
jgi:hypothetical protein